MLQDVPGIMLRVFEGAKQQRSAIIQIRQRYDPGVRRLFAQ